MSHAGGPTNRFLIVCTARTGSNLLVRSLNRPPRARCFGEMAKLSLPSEANVFAPFERLTGRGEQDLCTLQQTDVSGFIFDVVYSLPGEAVGFKIFYEHCRETGREGLWDRLAADEAIRVVHLTRNAAFDLYLSLLYAQRTDQWFTRRDRPDTPPNDSEDIEVDPEHCRRFLQRHLDSRDAASDLFRAHPLLEIDYADLERDLAGALANVRAFIGAPRPQEDPVPLIKQAARQAREKVRNYEAVRAVMNGTRLAALFGSD
jgi:LPS sulfotransferase NodH